MWLYAHVATCKRPNGPLLFIINKILVIFNFINSVTIVLLCSFGLAVPCENCTCKLLWHLWNLQSPYLRVWPSCCTRWQQTLMVSVMKCCLMLSALRTNVICDPCLWCLLFLCVWLNLAESLILNPAMFFLSWGARVKVPLNMNLPILQLKTCIETEWYRHNAVDLSIC